MDTETRLGEVTREVLTQLGVDPRAAEVYVALGRRGAEDEACLAAELGLTTEEMTPLIDELLRLSLVRRDHARRSLLVALAPRGPLVQLTTVMEEDVARRSIAVARVRQRVEEASELFDGLRSTDPLQMLRLETSTDVVNFLHRMADEVRDEVCTMVSNRPSPGALAESLEADRALLDRGVRLRVVYPAATRLDSSLTGYVRQLRDAGAEIRFAPVVPVRAVVYDRSVAVVAADPDALAQGAVVVRSGGLVSTVSWAFDQLWDHADEDRALPTVDGLSRVEQEVLRLFAQGMKDEAVARRMNVSVRTLRRLISQLSERLGASSRFELAAMATALGWVRPRLPVR